MYRKNIISFFLLFASTAAFAQFYNGTTMSVATTVSVFEDFENNAQVVYQTGADFQFKGVSYVNTASSTTLGVLGPVFNGTGSQTISGGGFTASMGALTLDNSNNLTVVTSKLILRNTLTFTTGKIFTPRGDTSIHLGFINANPSITGFDNNRNVDGYVSFLGNSAFTFPIGVGSIARPISMAASAGEFKAAFFNENPTTFVGPPQIGSLNSNKSSDVDIIGLSFGLWDIDGNNGAVFSFPFGDVSSLVSNISELILIGFNSTSNQWEKVGNVTNSGNTSGGNLTLNNALVPNSFSAYTFGKENSGTPLNLTVLLREAMFGLDMNDFLQSADPNFTLFTTPAIPLSSPYSVAPRTYAQAKVSTGPAGLVSDWILIEIRDAVEISNILESRSLLLKPNGSVVDINGGLPVFENRAGFVRIAVIHRNHMAVVSNSLQFNGNQVNYDFTSNLSQAYREDPSFDPDPMDLRDVQWCMWAGDIVSDGVIDNLDINMVSADFNNSLTDGYFLTDLNFDGIVDNLDYNYVIANFNLSIYNFQIYY